MSTRLSTGALEREQGRADVAFLRLLTTGETDGPRRVFERALAAAQVGRDLALEASCLLRLATVHHQCGDFEPARLALDRAAGVFADLGPARSVEEPYHSVGRGILAALDGDYQAALGWFDLARVQARRHAGDVGLLVDALSGPWLAFIDDGRIPGGARPTRMAERLAAAGLDDWMVLAHRTEVTLLLTEHRFAEAGRRGHELAATVPNPAERVRLLLPAAWGELWAGEPERAAATFTLAAEEAEALGARFLHSMALFGVAEADPSRATEVLLAAIAHAGRGPAWERLWASRPPVVFETLGVRRVLVGGHEVRFRSPRAAELLFCVALAGPGGIHWADLAALLWPESTDPARAASSVSTHTAKARRELRSEGWRLRRAGPTLWLERSNVTVDLDQTGGVVPPGVRFLPGWEERPWVAEVARRRRGGGVGAGA